MFEHQIITMRHKELCIWAILNFLHFQQLWVFL